MLNSKHVKDIRDDPNAIWGYFSDLTTEINKLNEKIANLEQRFI